MKSILIVGAGKEGKAYLGEVYAAAGWNISFLDRDEKVIDSLNAEGKYYVTLLREDKTEYKEVSGYKAYLEDEKYLCKDAVIYADVVALCMYPEDIKGAWKYLAPCMDARAKENPVQNLLILSCTNKNHIVKEHEKYLQEQMTDAEVNNWYKEKVAYRDVIVRRSANAKSNSDLHLTSKALQSLLIQGPVNVDISDVEWMEVCDDIEFLKDLKLFVHNCPHAACAYAGYYKKYHTIQEAEDDEEIAALMQGCLEEARAGIDAQFHPTLRQLEQVGCSMKAKEDEQELIRRVAENPLRKLARHDRLTGAAMYCLENGICPVNIAKAIAYGLKYDEPEDFYAVQMQKMLKTEGLKNAAQKIMGVSGQDRLVELVVREYERL